MWLQHLLQGEGMTGHEIPLNSFTSSLISSGGSRRRIWTPALVNKGRHHTSMWQWGSRNQKDVAIVVERWNLQLHDERRHHEAFESSSLGSFDNKLLPAYTALQTRVKVIKIFSLLLLSLQEKSLTLNIGLCLQNKSTWRRRQSL